MNDEYSQTERKRKLRWIHMMCKFTQFNSSYNYNIFVSLQRSRLLFKDFKQTYILNKHSYI